MLSPQLDEGCWKAGDTPGSEGAVRRRAAEAVRRDQPEADGLQERFPVVQVPAAIKGWIEPHAMHLGCSGDHHDQQSQSVKP